MIQKVFKPFWSYDIEKTENWLSFMAEQGYYFVEMNTKTRQFYFKETDPREVNFRIEYDKTQSDVLPVALINDGWSIVFNHRKWYVIANEKPFDEINNFPVREGIVRHNRMVMYIYSGILLYIIISSLPLIFLVGFTVLLGAPVEFVGSPFWVLTPFIWMVGLAVWVLVIYSTVKLYKTNRRFEMGTIIQTTGALNHAEKKRLKKSGELTVKRKVGWIYSPDKLEKWLVGMEEQGYNLSRISKLGVKFYFIKGTPRKVSYYADYQNKLDQGYFDMHQEAGWKLMYTSNAWLSKWSIWSHVYEEGEVTPKLYSDSANVLKHARRVAITYFSLFVPLVVIYTAIITLNIEAVLKDGMNPTEWMLFIIFILLIIEIGTLLLKSWFYYRRVKKDAEYI